MKDGLYSVKLKGFEGLDLPAGGVLFLRNGMMMGGGQYSYFTGSYSAKNGIFKGELVLNQHTPPRPITCFSSTKKMSAWASRAGMRAIRPNSLAPHLSGKGALHFT